ncbi:hypothetical protein A2Z00_02385 [Candidatus Gottesmanbacteria bacterium RBG_13_45_10]|uniref:Uncharacterized protein n=1 Tax=Candidatus Gottesmanbacteria bacterium RBG_13_45_10 TaxID=1798370 RepID=A0A1F5ZG74_9BACT|nr:MAG: hypothetical protein A2Z00_02385 [Candidatus Gottesmanbacteria bacterium RBG_13_45_10]
MKMLHIRSTFRDYSVVFTRNLKTYINSENKRPSHFLIDKYILSLYGNSLDLKKVGISRYSVDANEKNKSLERVAVYVRFLLKNNIHKDHQIVVIGGGMVQDIGSFTCHVILRGIRWIFVPTTLLSMSDSCIGSKSGINVGIYKNQVGTFHPPDVVYIDTKFLHTLPRTMILDGNGEIIKHAIIAGGKTFEYLVKHLSDIQTDGQTAQNVISQSLQVKKEIVEEDEFDRGCRRLLNYGHTFGHAIEGYTKNAVPHGVAVTMGMDMANYISVKRRLLSPKEHDVMSSLFHRNIPYPRFPITHIDRYMDFLSHDKKVIGNTVYALLCCRIGRVESVPVRLDNELKNDIVLYSTSYEEIRNRALCHSLIR